MSDRTDPTLAQLAERAHQADETARLFRAAAEKIEAARAGVEQAESRAAAQLDEARRNWWRVPAPGLYLIGEGSMDRVAESTAWTDEQLAAWVALGRVQEAVVRAVMEVQSRGPVSAADIGESVLRAIARSVEKGADR